MNLLIDPDLLDTDPDTNFDRPTALINRHDTIPTVFGYYDADPATGPRCGRCNDLLHVHLWQLVDPDTVEQGGVIDCRRQA